METSASDPIGFDDSAEESSSGTAESSTPTTSDPDEPTTDSDTDTAQEARGPEASFLQFKGPLVCPDGETRTAMLFWGSQRLPSATEDVGGDSYEEYYEAYQALLDEKQSGGFFGYTGTDQLGSYLMSPVADQPLQNRAAQRRVELTLDELPAPVVVGPNVFDETGVLDCMFDGSENNSFSIYDGDFECTEIDADRSFVLKEHAPGSQIFLAWIPSNGPDYVMADVSNGPTTFKARGIDTNKIEETVVVDFTFVEEQKNGRSELTMTGELLYQDDPAPQRCGGEWDVFVPR